MALKTLENIIQGKPRASKCIIDSRICLEGLDFL